MHDFTAEHTRRWDAWQHANAATARRSDRIARLFFGTILAAATLATVGTAMWP